jgi:hypothetical protein
MFFWIFGAGEGMALAGACDQSQFHPIPNLFLRHGVPQPNPRVPEDYFLSLLLPLQSEEANAVWESA